MGKKFVLFFGLVVGLVFIASLVIKSRVGDVRPALLPPSENTSKSFAGEAVKFPLKLPTGYSISLFAQELDGVRDLEFSPGGTLVASLTASGKVVALIDQDRDGKSDQTKEVLTNLNKPHGLAFYQGKLFVAEETRLSRFDWDSSNIEARLEKRLFDLPKGARHFTRNIVFNKKGEMFVTIGSTCDVCFEKDERNGSVIISDAEGKDPKVFAKGLRNSVFITINPLTDEIWGTEMGRDFLGDLKPPDEINIIQEGKDYGWPLCFGNRVHDTQFDKKVYIQTVPQLPCGSTEPPIYEIAAHSAPLGLTFIQSEKFPNDWQGDLLVAYHGSWNRSTPIGYKVVRMSVEGDKILGEEDFITGFLSGSQALGRPVDLVFDKLGNLYLSDDKTGVIYFITPNE